MMANFIGTGANGAVLAIGITVVVIHIAVAIALVVVSIMIIVMARKTGKGDAQIAQLGAVVLVVTFATGILTVITGSNWWSYAMSVGFIGAFLLYGKMYVDGRAAQV
jgi:heme A synthase